MTRARRSGLEGARLLAVLLGALAAMAAAILAIAGTGEDGLRMLVRATARTSIGLFALAFTASSLRRLWPTPGTGWLLRNRRFVGLAMAASHFTHLAALVALAGLVSAAQAGFGLVAVLGGGGAYAMLALMAITSTDAMQRRLGRERWRRLHGIGSWWVWLIFAQSYVPRAIEDVRYAPLAALTLAIPALRVAARRRVHQGVASTSSPSASASGGQ